MTRGNLQVSGPNPPDKRVVTISQPQRSGHQGEHNESLFLNVLRRRWMLLAACFLLSVGAAVYMAMHFTMPKAESQGELRYVSLPPSVQEVYRAPNTVELAEILRTNENMAKLARRNDLSVDPKDLRKRFEIRASHLSNIITVSVLWNDGKQAIDIVNDLMRIACETTTVNRRQILGRYRQDTETTLAAASQRVDEFRNRLLTLRRERDARLKEEGSIGSETQRLMSMITRAEELLDQVMLRKAALSQQLSSLRAEAAGLKEQIKQELLRSRRQQIEERISTFSRTSPVAVRLAGLKQVLEKFEAQNQQLDHVAWQAKLSTLGRGTLPEIDEATLRAVATIEQRLIYKQQGAERLELELLPMDNEMSLLEKRRESLERRLSERLSAEDQGLPSLEEAETRLEESQLARRSLQDQLDNIKRLEDTNFSEMTVLTPASWQTTDFNEGRHKVFVFTFAGCIVLLTLPIFGLEHFFPSGDPAERAAKSLGLPLVGQGTFVTQRLKHDKVQIHPVNSEAMRLLALRIQQSVHGPGAMVLFSGLNHDKSSIPMISYLAECLARREERVLIVDACDRPLDSRHRSSNEDHVESVLSAAMHARDVSVRVASDAPPSEATDLVASLEPMQRPGLIGLADFLCSHDVTADDMICRTSIPGVDMIPSGSTSFPQEGLAASRLTDLLDECRRRYTMILIAGPPTLQPSDLQMLSARADAILFTLPRNGRPSSRGEEVVQELLDLGAPVIGIVG